MCLCLQYTTLCKGPNNTAVWLHQRQHMGVMETSSTERSFFWLNLWIFMLLYVWLQPVMLPLWDRLMVELLWFWTYSLKAEVPCRPKYWLLPYLCPLWITNALFPHELFQVFTIIMCLELNRCKLPAYSSRTERACFWFTLIDLWFHTVTNNNNQSC